MVDQQSTLQAYTPGSDVAVGFNPSQTIWGRTGNDAILGYQPIKDSPNQPRVDILIGDVPIQSEPTPRDGRDTFILGDWKQSYYDNFGLNDYALINDFNPDRDIIQLHGTPNDYQLVNVGVGEELLQKKPTGADVIGIFVGNSNLNIGGKYFQFEGYTPPQGPVLPQTQQLGTSGFEITTTTATDPLGNVYIAGGTTGSLGGLNKGDSRDAFVAKYDSQGNQLWTKQLGTSSFDTIYGIATDNQGNFYVAAITAGNLGATKQAVNTDTWVAKYDSNGNQQWIRQFGQNLISQSFSIDVDANSNVYLSGIDVRSSPDIATDDFWVTKYDTYGNQKWFKETGTPNTYDESYGVTVGSDGSIYATGWTLGDLGGNNAGLYDNWIGKYNNTGQLQWIKQFGTPDYDWSWGVDTDSQGNVYATGWTLGDLGGKNAGSYDAWVAKFDSQGNQLGIIQFGTPGDDEAFRIHIDSNDNIFLTGYTNNTSGGPNAGSYDAWVAKYDTKGNQVWIKQFGTPELDQAYGITSDNAGNLYVTGITGGSFGDINAGSFDAWVAKLDAATGNLEDFSGTSKIGTDGNDTIAGGLGDQQIFGGAGDDVLRGDSDSPSSGGSIGGNDIIYGGAGNDLIGGKGGNDLLYGDEGNDKLWGNNGDDVLRGGLGNDTLVGDTGRDTFVLVNGEGTDTILDFRIGEDVIGLAGGLTFGQLSITPDGNNTLIGFDNKPLAILNWVQANTLTDSAFTPFTA